MNTLRSKKEVIRKGDRYAKKLAEYLKYHELDPLKDWSKHPEHGPFIEKMRRAIRIAEEMAVDEFTKQRYNSVKKPKTKPKKANKPLDIYDYPESDGMPLNPVEKRQYRKKIRRYRKSGINLPTNSK